MNLTQFERVNSELKNRRYDLIMKNSSCKAYIANGVVVQARQNRGSPGYSYV